ncbi:MAG: hypothetical protein ACRCYQ_15645 [Nocardioides sp.]
MTRQFTDLVPELQLMIAPIADRGRVLEFDRASLESVRDGWESIVGAAVASEAAVDTSLLPEITAAATGSTTMFTFERLVRSEREGLAKITESARTLQQIVGGCLVVLAEGLANLTRLLDALHEFLRSTSVQMSSVPRGSAAWWALYDSARVAATKTGEEVESVIESVTRTLHGQADDLDNSVQGTDSAAAPSLPPPT